MSIVKVTRWPGFHDSSNVRVLLLSHIPALSASLLVVQRDG